MAQSKGEDSPDESGRLVVSFDFDGVLARSPFGYGVLFPVLDDLAQRHAQRNGTDAKAARERTKKLAMKEFRRRLELGRHVEAYNWESITRAVARELGDRFDGSFTRMTRDYADRIANERDLSLLYPGAREVLASLKERGICLLLLTNGLREYQLPMVEALGLADHFHAILASDDLQAVKPFPEAFRRAFRACPEGRGTKYHVGDTLSQDVEGARGADVFAIWISWELPDQITRLDPIARAAAPALDNVLRKRLTREDRTLDDLSSVRPDAVVASLEEIEPLVTRP